MFNSLLILNSINNYILNYNSNIQTRGGLGAIFSALATMAMGYAKGIAIIVGLVTGAAILGIAFIVGLFTLIDYLVKKNDAEAKKSESKFEIRMRNSSVIIATRKENEIINDKDIFDINNPLDLELTVKSQGVKDTRCRAKINSKYISDEEIENFFVIRDLTVSSSWGIASIVWNFIIGVGIPKTSFHLRIERLKKLPNNIESVSVDFDFDDDDAIINGYSSTNFSIGVR